jgi:hypothetical protein
MTKIRGFHGTVAAPFAEFRIPPSGAHFGSFDQAVHAATLKLARMPAKEFALLREDVSGWRGRILEVEIELRNPLRVKDARTGAAWSKVIAQAAAAGYDSLIYENDYEGRRGPRNPMWSSGLSRSRS